LQPFPRLCAPTAPATIRRVLTMALLAVLGYAALILFVLALGRASSRADAVAEAMSDEGGAAWAPREHGRRATPRFERRSERVAIF
jgi:hypothetical protein